MIKPANLKEELFLVLIPKKENLISLLKIQKIISEHYDLYDKNSYPELHITIDRIRKNKINDTIKIIQNLIKNINNIEIDINNFKCYNNKEKFLVLKINKNNTLDKFTKKLHYALSKKEISTIQNYDEWEFHISLISNQFAKNPIPDSDFTKLCFTLDNLPQHICAQIDKIEIWRPTLEKTEKCIASFKL